MNTMVAETRSILIAREELSSGLMDEMFELLTRHFEGVTPTQFTLDLAGKNWVLLLLQEERIVGFSTFAAYESTFRGETLTVLYSGDTIVAPEAWNSTALARGWIAAVRAIRDEKPFQRCVWLLLTSGFRTYRFLPVFWRAFYPSISSAMPAPDLLEHLARERFGGEYIREQGIVRFAKPQRLNGDLQVMAAGRRRDPHIDFFLKKNPGWTDGDELVCMTELSDENLTPPGRRRLGER